MFFIINIVINLRYIMKVPIVVHKPLIDKLHLPIISNRVYNKNNINNNLYDR